MQRNNLSHGAPRPYQVAQAFPVCRDTKSALSRGRAEAFARLQNPPPQGMSVRVRPRAPLQPFHICPDCAAGKACSVRFGFDCWRMGDNGRGENGPSCAYTQSAGARRGVRRSRRGGAPLRGWVIRATDWVVPVQQSARGGSVPGCDTGDCVGFAGETVASRPHAGNSRLRDGRGQNQHGPAGGNPRLLYFRPFQLHSPGPAGYLGRLTDRHAGGGPGGLIRMPSGVQGVQAMLPCPVGRTCGF